MDSYEIKRHGEECKRLLIEMGAPANGVAADAPVTPKRGSIGRGRDRSDNVRPISNGNSVDAIAGRLKRDNPELAEQVIAGRISAHAAAVQAGAHDHQVSDPPVIENMGAGLSADPDTHRHHHPCRFDPFHRNRTDRSAQACANRDRWSRVFMQQYAQACANRKAAPWRGVFWPVSA